MSRRYLTTPIYYVNGDPHVGHAHTSVMADVLKSLDQMRGLDVWMTTGTDEHGQKNQEAAVASGLPPDEYLTRQSARFRVLFERLNVRFDQWVRTTTPAHKAVVTEALSRIHARGLITQKEYHGLYCVGCELFKKKTDLDAEGRCPDHLVPPVEMNETNYFITLGKYQAWLVEQIEKREDWIHPAFYRRELLAMLRAPLDDLCISRPKNRVWLGVELPFDSSYVTYVWFDALLNYLSNIGWPDQKYLEWWPSSVHLMAKDIIKTHCIYWPIILKMLDVEPPAGYRVHGFWVGEGGAKMSKSLGNVVVPDKLIDRVGTDGLRFYLTKTMRGVDAQISDGLVATSYNADLANNVGNLFSRVVKFSRKQYGGKVPQPPADGLHPEDAALSREITQAAQAAFERADLETLPEYSQQIIAIANRLNTSFEQLAPWTLAKAPDGADRLASGLYATLDSIRILFELASPIIPGVAERALRNLGAAPIARGERHSFTANRLPAGATLGEDSNLFPRLAP
jgi:methionyl-tRNA synthetase